MDSSSTPSSNSSSRSSSTSQQPAAARPIPIASRGSSSSPGAGSAQRTPSSSFRQSYMESLRGLPSSPRSQQNVRRLSFSSNSHNSALRDLVNQPFPSPKGSDPRFSGRNWQDITVDELRSEEESIEWVTYDTSVEQATKALVRSPHNVVLIRSQADDTYPSNVFDYGVLNAYLLMAVGLAPFADEGSKIKFEPIALKASRGEAVPLRDIKDLLNNDPPVSIQNTEVITKAIEAFSHGVHQILVTDASGTVISILGQVKLVEFFWKEAVHFPAIDLLYVRTLKELGLGNQKVISVGSDKPLTDALLTLHMEALNNVAIVDKNQNVVGNIDLVDLNLLTSASNAHLLQAPCSQFLARTLSERGVQEGRDPFPVFYVNLNATLAHTVAKIVATQSHLMAVVDSPAPSPAPSAPHTPTLGAASLAITAPGTSPSSPSVLGRSGDFVASLKALDNPNSLSGRLCGVVSLTDILNMFARTSGLSAADPNELRSRRRRDSSISVRPNLDVSQAPFDLGLGGGGPGRY